MRAEVFHVFVLHETGLFLQQYVTDFDLPAINLRWWQKIIDLLPPLRRDELEDVTWLWDTGSIKFARLLASFLQSSLAHVCSSPVADFCRFRRVTPHIMHCGHCFNRPNISKRIWLDWKAYRNFTVIFWINSMWFKLFAFGTRSTALTKQKHLTTVFALNRLCGISHFFDKMNDWDVSNVW